MIKAKRECNAKRTLQNERSVFSWRKNPLPIDKLTRRFADSEQLREILNEQIFERYDFSQDVAKEITTSWIFSDTVTVVEILQGCRA